MITREQILDRLKGIIDPEIGINVVDLGLVYLAEEKEGEIRVEMTMTTAACPLGSMIRDQAAAAVKKGFPEARSVKVDLVWSPPWNADMMSDDAKRKLGRLK